MDIDRPHGGQSIPIGKCVTIGPVDGVVAPRLFVVTPINPNPKMPRGQEIVKEIRARAPGIILVGVSSSSLPGAVCSVGQDGAAPRLLL
jgi:hypothetical protein